MPELDGWQTLERIRDLSDVPVLMLTARGAELEKVRGLQAGADDYVTKPFGRQELLARVEALLRRAGGRAVDDEAYADGFIRSTSSSGSVAVEGETSADAARVQPARGVRPAPGPGALATSSCSSSSGATPSASRATR